MANIIFPDLQRAQTPLLKEVVSNTILNTQVQSQPFGILTKFCVFIILPFLDLSVCIFMFATRRHGQISTQLK